MKGKQTGFTLVELMVTLAVLAVVVSIAIPNFRQMIETNRVATATNALVASLQQARAEAVRRNARITLCKGSDSDTDCAAGSNWNIGWILFEDHKISTGLAIDASDDIILGRGGQGLASTISIRGAGTGPGYVSFTSDGRFKSVGSNPAPVSTTLRVCSTSAAVGNGQRARDISILASGAISSTTPASVPASCPAP